MRTPLLSIMLCSTLACKEEAECLVLDENQEIVATFEEGDCHPTEACTSCVALSDGFGWLTFTGGCNDTEFPSWCRPPDDNWDAPVQE